jgi:V/A-type H+-transporting ATPase subunit I
VAVVEMTGISLIGPEEEVVALAAELLTLGNFEPVPLEFALERRPASLSSGGARIVTFQKNPYDELLDKLDYVWDAAGSELPEDLGCTRGAPSYSGEECVHRVAEVAHRIEDWKRRQEVLEEKREKLLAAGDFLDALAAADRSVEESLNTKFLSITFGRLSSENYKKLEEMSAVTPILVYPAASDKGYVLAIIFCAREYMEEAEKIFRSVYLKEYELAEIFEGAGPELAGRLKERRLDSERELRVLREAPRNYLERSRAEMEKLYCSVHSLQRVYALCQKRGELSGIFVLSGIIPAPTLEKVAGSVETLGPNTLLLAEEGRELRKRGRELPTLLKNNFLAKTFQEIVALYSLPSYGETDPSPLVALSFCLFFGFMFGDVGHGFLIAAGAWYLARRKILKKAFASVISIAGVSAMIFGLLYGSVFGSEEILPSLWTSPMKGVDDLIRTSLFVGVAFMSMGILINILALKRERKWGKMLFDGDGLAGLLFYWSAAGAAAMTFASAEGPPDALMVLCGVLFLAILFSSVLDRLIFGPGEKGEGGVVHTFSVFHALLSFLSNTASFVRLAAFALNHAGLSAAVFMLSDMVRNLPGGVVFRAAVLLAGNIIIVGLEGLIVFIQTLRLEYYEFFSKFYQGGGRPFSPVTWENHNRD